MKNFVSRMSPTNVSHTSPKKKKQKNKIFSSLLFITITKKIYLP